MLDHFFEILNLILQLLLVWMKKISTKTINRKRTEKNNETSKTILESVDLIVNIGATSTSITLSITGIDLIVLRISAGIACTQSSGNKVLDKLIINNYSKYKKLYEKGQQTIITFDKLYRKELQDILIDKNEYESLCNTFTKYLEKKQKMNLFL